MKEYHTSKSVSGNHSNLDIYKNGTTATDIAFIK